MAKSDEIAKMPLYNYVKHSSVEGLYAVCSNITQNCFDSAVRFQPDPGDTFIVSYPKSGTTWVMNIIYLLQNNGIPVAEGALIDDVIPFLEFDGGEVAQKLPTPRLIKTHLYRSMLPFRDDAKYVFVARNPKDVVVSFYYHTVGFDEYYNFKTGKFDDFFEVFIDGGCDFGDYFKMVSEWYEESKHKSNVHMTLYEDIKTNAKSEILKLADFLGNSYKKKLLDNNEKLLNIILDRSSFSKMQEAVKSFCLEERPEELPFVRKGVIGDWRNHLSRAQSEQIEKRIEETDKNFPGFAGLWSKYDNLLRF